MLRTRRWFILLIALVIVVISACIGFGYWRQVVWTNAQRAELEPIVQRFRTSGIPDLRLIVNSRGEVMMLGTVEEDSQREQLKQAVAAVVGDGDRVESIVLPADDFRETK